MYGWLVKILFGFYSCIWLIKWIDPIHTSYQTVLKLWTRNITKSRKALITCRSSLFVTNCTTRNHISSLTKSPALSINWRITSTYLHGIFLVWCLYAQSQEDTEKDLHGNHAYHERSGANFSARIAALSDNSSRIANSAVLRYYKQTKVTKYNF